MDFIQLEAIDESKQNEPLSFSDGDEKLLIKWTML